MNKTRDHFTFFKSFRDQIDLCCENDQLRLYRAITDFALFHQDSTFDEPLLNMAWLGIKPHLEKSWTKFNNGCAGGAPVGNNNASKNNQKTTENNQETTEKQTIGMECKGVYSIVEDKKETTIVAKKDFSLELKKRKEDFYHDILQYVSEYQPAMLNDFYSYWTESTKSGKKMRFELEKTWDTKKRLQRWSRNNFQK